MRSDQTPTETRLWQALRANRLNGLKVRRQAPIGPFIADFVIPAAKLIIELDGSHHVESSAYDNDRTSWLKSQGYRVIRFWNGDITTNLEGVLQTILHTASLSLWGEGDSRSERGEGPSSAISETSPFRREPGPSSAISETYPSTPQTSGKAQ